MQTNTMRSVMPFVIQFGVQQISGKTVDVVLKITANEATLLPGRCCVWLEQEPRGFYATEAEDKAICGKICFFPSQGSTTHRSDSFAVFGDNQLTGVCVEKNDQIRVRFDGLFKETCEFALRAITREPKCQFVA